MSQEGLQRIEHAVNLLAEYSLFYFFIFTEFKRILAINIVAFHGTSSIFIIYRHHHADDAEENGSAYHCINGMNWAMVK